MPLIIPVENQVRELDSKLLLACIAARRGFASYIGSHRHIDLRITAFPRSLYLCKSFTARNLKMLRIMRKLGHSILSWDEEALVHLPADMYFSRRLSPDVMPYISHLFAWGDDNAELWRGYPSLPADLPIHVTGNPRSDLLRPEFRIFYRHEAEAIRRAHGSYILVNTNFNHVNAYFPAQNLFRPAGRGGARLTPGKAGLGMSLEFAEALRDHKQALFEHFQQLIPALEQAFPHHTVVVRPHPTENPRVYHAIASRCERVRVACEGNVVPWLMNASALVHNGCTTGVEAYAIGVPAISYHPCVDVDIDEGFYYLPNQLSYQCFDQNELFATLARIIDGHLGVANGGKRRRLFNRHVCAVDPDLACTRMVDVLDAVSQENGTRGKPDRSGQVSGWCLANGRRLVKWATASLPGTHAPPDFHRHRYPGISLEQLRARLDSLQRVLGDDTPIRTEQVHDHIYRISA